jgi:thioredoxin:protein disulfide reductase
MTQSRWTRRARTLLTALIGATLTTAALAAEVDFLDPAQAFRGQARVQGANAIEVRIDVASDYHLYRERMSVELDGAGARLGPVDLPAGKVKFDETFQKNVEVLEGAVLIRVPIEKANADFRVRVNYQGCADKGLCYPPQTAFVAAGVSGGKLERARWLDEDTSSAVTVAPAAAPAVTGSSVAAPARP